MSLRTKIFLALLASSLIAVGLVGVVAQQRLQRKFGEAAGALAADRFRADVASYIQTYGSWDAAWREEEFRSFVRRRGRQEGRPEIVGLRAPPADAQPSDADDVQPMAPMAGPPPHRRRDVGAGRLMRAPFRFMLFDPAGRVLLAVDPYRVGDTVSPADREGAEPVVLQGRVVAYALPKGQPNLSDLDLGYLAAMREALLYGIGAAAVLALGLGWLLGSQLSASLRRLAHAIERTRDGQLGLQAEVRGRDEIAKLAATFNRMSLELAEKDAALRELATRDALTHLHNRRHFDECAGALCEKAARGEGTVAVMLGDVDRFKQINDRFSHAVGDQVLSAVGRILRQHTRSTDVVARYGGEEFVVAFVDTDLTQAHALCDKLRAAIAAYDWREIHPELQVTMSIGVAALRREQDLGSVLRSADELLYEAKSSGRNRVCAAQ